MSHVRPDTCAMEYVDAFRHASGFGVEETKRKRDVLAERIRRAKNLNYSTVLMDAALRGYDDWLEFRARHEIRPVGPEITHDEEGNPLPVMPDITHQPIKESDEELDILK